jgi:hypothetical protein
MLTLKSPMLLSNVMNWGKLWGKTVDGLLTGMLG